MEGKKWSKNALRYTRGVGISKIKPLWLLILVSFLIKITSRTLSGLCMGSRPTGRTVQERLFKRIRISSDCEEALQTSCISHSQTHSCPQITSVRLVSDIIWILFHNFFFRVIFAGRSGFCRKRSRVLFEEPTWYYGFGQI